MVCFHFFSGLLQYFYIFFSPRYKAIEISILKKSNILTQIQRCVYCLNHTKIQNDYKIGKTKLFLRYWHIDILNQISKKYLNQIIITQKGKLTKHELETNIRSIETIFTCARFIIQESIISYFHFYKKP
jgi:hypothetical protein